MLTPLSEGNYFCIDSLFSYQSFFLLFLNCHLLLSLMKPYHFCKRYLCKIFFVCQCDLRNCVNHVQSHFHTAVGMVCLGLGQSRHTVVTVPQNLDPPAVVLLEMQKNPKTNMVGCQSLTSSSSTM